MQYFILRLVLTLTMLFIMTSCATKQTYVLKTVQPLPTPRDVMCVSYNHSNCSVVAGGWHSQIYPSGKKICWHQLKEWCNQGCYGCNYDWGRRTYY